MFCPKCGNKMNDGAQFCGNCGWSTNGATASIRRKVDIPIVPIVGVIFVIAVVMLVKTLFFGGKFRSAKLVTNFRDAKLVTSYSQDTTINQMDTVSFGSYPQSDASGIEKEPIEWIVLDRQGNKALLLSKYILDCKCYNNEYTDVTWETCSLRNWLNNDFYYRAFSSDEQKKIISTNVINNNNIDYGTTGGNNTNDKVFCLSIEETRKYFGEGVKENYGYQLGKNVAARGTNYAKAVDNNGYNLNVVYESFRWYNGNSYFWLRSPGDDQKHAARVSYVGYLRTYGDAVFYRDYGVRPALWVEY